MKKKLFLIIFAFCLFLPACAAPYAGNNGDEGGAIIQYSYAEDLRTMEDVMRYSSHIVKAKLTAVEPFDGGVYVYHFDVKEDYTNNTADQIHMYDAACKAYVVGHTYYLFLNSGERALYPHTIYTTVVKDLIVDTNKLAAKTTINGNDISLVVKNAPETICAAIKEGYVGERTAPATEISEESNITRLAEQTDVIARIKVSAESQANRYASSYAVVVEEILKGPKESVPMVLSLPPGLDRSKSYYIFLKAAPTGDGAYLLFSRTYPVLEVAQVSRSILMG